ncbi:MAG: FMN-binding protein [Roseburia sp.]|nr:FMN-binding protein [Roseburia sp.]
MKIKSLLMPVIVICLFTAILFGAKAGTAGAAQANYQEELNTLMLALLPGSTSFTEEAYEGEDANIKAVYRADNGCVIMTSTYGYASDVVMLIGVTNEGDVKGLVVREMAETYGLGAEALSDTDFLAQFLWTEGDAEIGTNVDAITGATVTSKAVTRSVNSAVGFMTGVDATTSATTWGE